MSDNQVKPKDSMPYASNVILPSVLEVHTKIKKGYFGRETWNCVLDLLLRCPKEVVEKIDFQEVLEADSGKKLILSLFVQIRVYLEKNGYLIRKSKYEVGSL